MRYLHLFFVLVIAKPQPGQGQSGNSSTSSKTGIWMNSTAATTIDTPSSSSSAESIPTTGSHSVGHLTRDSGDRPHLPYRPTKAGEPKPTARSKTRTEFSSIGHNSKDESDVGPILTNLPTSPSSSIPPMITTTTSAPTTPPDIVPSITTPQMITSIPSSSTLSSALPSIEYSSTEQEITPTPPTRSASQPTSTLDSCYTAMGGLQEDGNIDTGCGAMLHHIQSCHDLYDPGANLVDPDQNAIFQACVCGTAGKKGFTWNSILYKNFTGCAACLLDTKIFNFEEISVENEKIWDFCRSQNPFPFTFYYELNQWIQQIQTKATGLTLVIPALTGVTADAPHFTTIPPLANVAYGISAPHDGSLAKVTPSLTTFTTLRPNPAGSDSIRATVTSLAAWVPTKAGKAWNKDSAAHSEVQAASSRLTSALCYGRGPGQRPSTTSLNRVPMALLWLLVAFAAGLPPVVMLF